MRKRDIKTSRGPGRIIRDMRTHRGLSLRDAGRELGISYVHLCNVENGRSQAGPDLLIAVRSVWGLDPYVFAWLLDGDENRLPPKLRKAAATLARQWWCHLRRRAEP